MVEAARARDISRAVEILRDNTWPPPPASFAPAFFNERR
jgi:hypothetical protein